MTAYPFGNNDCVKSYGNISSINNPLTYKPNHPYFNLKLTRGRNRPAHRPKKQKTHVDIAKQAQAFINVVRDTCNISIIRCCLYSLKKKVINFIIKSCYEGNFLDQLCKEKTFMLLCLLVSFNLLTHRNLTVFHKILIVI